MSRRAPQHADIKICIGEYELPANAVVLASRSQYFEKVLGENFRGGQTKQFHFKEESRAHAHGRVFEYMYTGGYSEDTAQELASQSWHPVRRRARPETELNADDDELFKDVRVHTTVDYFLACPGQVRVKSTAALG
ncbi:putative BTB POZ domain-containing protein [Rosellinia necatrix]|uniref:Putative BTB POZ domain-containing protein n=1 Tax=Rosellinia necatrix TaxID=77044 RepID=A0A1W2TSM4_ROSNE|nr:putative BTB POZ domain-containing protein [Rosellinia necatrix]